MIKTPFWYFCYRSIIDFSTCILFYIVLTCKYEEKTPKQADWSKMIIETKKCRVFKVIHYRKLKPDVLGFENSIIQNYRCTGVEYDVRIICSLCTKFWKHRKYDILWFLILSFCSVRGERIFDACVLSLAIVYSSPVRLRNISGNVQFSCSMFLQSNSKY